MHAQHTVVAAAHYCRLEILHFERATSSNQIGRSAHTHACTQKKKKKKKKQQAVTRTASTQPPDELRKLPNCASRRATLLPSHRRQSCRRRGRAQPVDPTLQHCNSTHTQDSRSDSPTTSEVDSAARRPFDNIESLRPAMTTTTTTTRSTLSAGASGANDNRCHS